MFKNNNQQISYSELFRNRFIKHDATFNEALQEHICPKVSHRRKRNHHDAFINPDNNLNKKVNIIIT